MAADTITYYDYEFHFTSGPPLYVTVQDQRDIVIDDATTTIIISINEPDRIMVMNIAREKLNAWQCSQRTEKKEFNPLQPDFAGVPV